MLDVEINFYDPSWIGFFLFLTLCEILIKKVGIGRKNKLSRWTNAVVSGFLLIFSYFILLSSACMHVDRSTLVRITDMEGF